MGQVEGCRAPGSGMGQVEVRWSWGQWSWGRVELGSCGGHVSGGGRYRYRYRSRSRGVAVATATALPKRVRAPPTVMAPPTVVAPRARRRAPCTWHGLWAWVWAWAWAWAMGMRRALVRGSTAALTSVTCAAPSSVSALCKARLTRVSSGAAWDLLAWGLSPLGSARLGFEPTMAYGSWKSPSPSPGFET